VAGRDFASVKATSRGKKRHSSRKSSTAPRALWLAMPLLLLAGFAAGWWFGKSQGTVRIEVDHQAEQRLQARLAQQRARIERLEQENAKLRKQLHRPKDDVGELTFYSELPKQSVKPAPLGEHAAPREKQARQAPREDHVSRLIAQELQGETKGFRIQVGSFRRRADAEALLRRLRQQHVTAMVRAADVPGKGRWYRVIAGPFHSRLLADHARATIERKLHLHGLVVYGAAR